MPGKQPEIVRAFRIVHISNMEYLLTHGIYTKGHAMSDPNYISIGDTTLITQRNDYTVGINPPNGLLGEYIPFYFGYLSPMLYNIYTGYRGITKLPQDEIVYIVCNIPNLINTCNEWCFTDGHAKNKISKFYNSIDDFDKIDWNVVFVKDWRNTEEDYDKMRRKQAEFLVKNHVPVNCINGIIVHNEQRKLILEEVIERLHLNIPVVVSPNKQFYY